jgi:hypothetical protein
MLSNNLKRSTLPCVAHENDFLHMNEGRARCDSNRAFKKARMTTTRKSEGLNQTFCNLFRFSRLRPYLIPIQNRAITFQSAGLIDALTGRAGADLRHLMENCADAIK